MKVVLTQEEHERLTQMLNGIARRYAGWAGDFEGEAIVRGVYGEISGDFDFTESNQCRML